MNIIEQIIKKGDELSELRNKINKLEEEIKLTVEPLKIKKDELQEELKMMLSQNNLKSIKSSNGDNYILATKKGVLITDDKKALKWCIEHNAISIDKTAIKSVLSTAKELPEGFEFSEQEYISVRKAKEDNK
jgi:hypothetical protein